MSPSAASPHGDPYCPVCPGQGNPLGRLGRAHWFRCRNCGTDFQNPDGQSSCQPSSHPHQEGEQRD